MYHDVNEDVDVDNDSIINNNKALTPKDQLNIGREMVNTYIYTCTHTHIYEQLNQIHTQTITSQIKYNLY